MKREDQLTEIVRLFYKCSAADEELQTKHGIGDLGLVYRPRPGGFSLSEKSRAYLAEARDVGKPLEGYLNGLSESELAQIEAIMYFGRDHEGVHGNDLTWLRKHLEQNRSGVSDLVRNISEKCNALPLYFSEALQKADKEGIDLNQEF
ncbi:MAG: hypothetical protein ACREV3_10410 [Gammaproteobacteria bacterium]